MRSMMTGGVVAVCAGLSCAMAASAQPFNITIDQSQSNVTVRLCLIGSCTQDTSPATGFFRMAVNSASNPTQVSLSDFRIALTESLILNISFGFLGRFDSTANNLVISYADPGVVLGPVALTADAFTFAGVRNVQEGTIAYNATGLVCTQLGASGLPCNSAINLADQGVGVADQVAGTLTVVNRVATLTGTINTTSPIDPMNPALGTITVTGTIRGTGTVPCVADCDGNNEVDVNDFFCYLTRYAANDLLADVDGSGTVDINDFFTFLTLFSAGC